MKKFKSIISSLAILGLIVPLSLGSIFPAEAVSAGVSVSVDDTSLNASTTYYYGFTTSAALSASTSNDKVVFSIQHWFAGPYMDGAKILFDSATIYWVKDDGAALGSAQAEVFNNGEEIRIKVPGPLTIASGSSISIKLGGVKNPSEAGSYSVSMTMGEDTTTGWNEGERIQTDNVLTLGIDKYIEGHVTYDSGGPVSTCSVNANMEGGENAWANANCDANGFFSLPISQTGTWSLHLGAKWEESGEVTTDWIFDGFNEIVNVSAAGTFTKNFVVSKANSVVAGKIYLPNGTCASEPWQYHVDVRNEMGQGSGGSLSNDCSFSIPVKAGTYKLSIHSQNPQYYLPEIKVTVAADETKNVGIKTLKEKTAQIKGRVLDANGNPISNMRMNMWGYSGWADAMTTSTGDYTLWGYKGEWEVRPDDWDASQKGLISTDPPVRVNITSDSQIVTGVNFTLQHADAEVTLNFTGVEIEGQMFGWAYCRKAGAMPGPGGEFGAGLMGTTATIPLLGGETYTCGAHLPPEMGVSLDKEVEVYVAKNEEKTVTLKLIRNNAEIVGYLRNAKTGAVITDVGGDVFAMGEGIGMGYHAFVNYDGSYRLSVRGGSCYNIGHHIREGGYMEGNPDFSPTCVSANSRVVKDLDVYKADAKIRATVKDPNGNPVSWAWVWCDNFKQKEEEVKGPFDGGEVRHAGSETDMNGVANVDVLAGTYSCGAGMPPEMASYMPPDMVDVTALTGQKVSITLQFKEADGSISGNVFDENGSKVNMGFCHAWSPEGGFSGGPVFGGVYNIPLSIGSWYVGCDSMDGQSFYRSDEVAITLSEKGDLNKNFVLRKSDFEIPESVSTTINASALTVVTLPDGSNITLPANFVDTSQDSSYTLTATPTIDIYSTVTAKPALGFAWDLQLSQSGQSVTDTFNSDVSICFSYDDAMLEKNGIEETTIVGNYWDANKSSWMRPTGVTLDTEGNQVCFNTNHFTEFAITTGSNQMGARTNKSIVTAPKAGGGPHITMWDSAINKEANFMAYGNNFRGGVKAVTADLDGDGTNEIVTVPYSGGGPHVRAFNSDGENIANVFPYAMAFRGGLSLAAGDVDGDGADEIIIAPSNGGGPHVRVYKYSDGSFSHYASWFAYTPELFTGIEVYAGDVDGDGADEVVTTTKSGATPHVRIFNGDGTFVNHFFAFAEAFKGGVNVTLGDYNGDGAKDIVVSPASGGGPQYRIFNYEGGLLTSGFAYDSSWRMGMKTGVGDVDGDNEIEIITAPSTGGPHVKVFGSDGSLESHFMAYVTDFRGGLELSVADIDADGIAEIITVPMGEGGPHVKIQNATGGLVNHFMSHYAGFRGGVNLSISQ